MTGAARRRGGDPQRTSAARLSGRAETPAMPTFGAAIRGEWRKGTSLCAGAGGM